MKNEILYIANSKKLDELIPEARWSAQCWLNECWALNLQFRVSEVYRTQDTQNRYARQGRFAWEDCLKDVRGKLMTLAMAKRIYALVQKDGGIRGNKVTWTLDSEHIQRLATDIYPINCTHADIYAVAKKYNIEHKWPTLDPPHYSFGDTKRQPQVVLLPKLSADAEMQRFARGIERLRGKEKERAMSRFEKNYGFSYAQAL